MSYSDDYRYCKNRYKEACSEINYNENTLIDLQSRKQKKINQINQLKTDLKNHKEALESITQIQKKEEQLKSGLGNIRTKTSLAADNYNEMVKKSDFKNKVLSDVYSDETTKTKHELENIIVALKNKKAALNNKIEVLQQQLQQSETDLRNIDADIRNTNTRLQDWKITKRNASLDMEYYRRRMNED